MTEQESQEFQEFLAIRKEAGLKIDPATAEVEWVYAQTLDPYGIDPDLPWECRQVGRQYFACSPGSDIWVWFGDLPDAARDALWEKHKHKLAFPAGLDIDIPDAVQSEFATVVERDWKRVVSFNAMRAALRRVLEAQLREFLKQSMTSVEFDEDLFEAASQTIEPLMDYFINARIREQCIDTWEAAVADWEG